jgi:hypothetical protein
MCESRFINTEGSMQKADGGRQLEDGALEHDKDSLRRSFVN